MTTSTLVYTSSIEANTARDAARHAAFDQALASVAAEGNCFNVKINDDFGKHRGYGWTARMVACALVDEDTDDIEYWPINDPDEDN